MRARATRSPASRWPWRPMRRPACGERVAAREQQAVVQGEDGGAAAAATAAGAPPNAQLAAQPGGDKSEQAGAPGAVLGAAKRCAIQYPMSVMLTAGRAGWQAQTRWRFPEGQPPGERQDDPPVGAGGAPVSDVREAPLGPEPCQPAEAAPDLAVPQPMDTAGDAAADAAAAPDAPSAADPPPEAGVQLPGEQAAVRAHCTQAQAGQGCSRAPRARRRLRQKCRSGLGLPPPLPARRPPARFVAPRPGADRWRAGPSDMSGKRNCRLCSGANNSSAWGPCRGREAGMGRQLRTRRVRHLRREQQTLTAASGRACAALARQGAVRMQSNDWPYCSATASSQRRR